MTYAEAMGRYGSDKPDLRFGIELTELTEYFAETAFRVFQDPYVGAVVMPGGASQPRRQLDAWQEWAKQRGARGLAYVLVGEDGALGAGPGRQEPVRDRAGGAGRPPGAEPGDCIFFAAGHAERRPRAARRGPRRDRPADRRWSTRAPGRSSGSSTRRCSRPVAGRDVAVGTAVDGRAPRLHLAERRLDRQVRVRRPASALAYAYDIVCNGNEIGGGSIRIHRADVQQRVFAMHGHGRGGGRRRSSGSCSTRSPTARRRTAASRSAGTASACCSPAPTRCAR